MKALSILALGFLSAPAFAQETGYSAEKMSADSLQHERDAADEHARNSNLPALKEGGPDEVRVWWEAFGGSPTSYVMTYGGSQMCRSGRCKPYAPRMTREQIHTWLLRLRAFADQSIVCTEVEDGDWMTIDAVLDGKRFIVSANNPSWCDGDGAKLVARFLRKIDTGRPPNSTG